MAQNNETRETQEAQAALQRAIEALRIRTVELRGMKLEIPDELILSGLDVGQLAVQGKQHVARAFQIDGTERSTDILKVAYQIFRFRAGVRVVVPDDLEHYELEPGQQLLLLEADFDAQYRVRPDGLDDEAVHAFAHRNVGYHVWPYWREFVQSTLARAGLPGQLPVPHYLARDGATQEPIDGSDD